MTQDEHPFERSLFEKLRSSELFVTYQNAFRSATGLPLRLVDNDTGTWCLDDAAVNRSPFCEKLNLCSSACHACITVNRLLMEEAKVNGPTTCHCFAGLSASAVPILAGNRLIGFLKTGQVFHSVPDEEDFRAVAKTLQRQGLTERQAQEMRTAYLQTRSVEPERYQSMITLLATFGDQLGKHAEKLAIIDANNEPSSVARAKKYIEKNLSEPLPLALVAKQAGVSESHFCRLFKEATQLTLTDYINRRRIEWAKRELLKPEVRISEIAFQIGYQSLSQFNRSFARFTGNSPTNFRREELARAAS
ncbi:PocR ligand-binding domain-containing protein [Luteolibacter sp. SL250]|uniref:helix-turn-helix domain-containing protein n=1 Tax=Luteolibacter sp. SL250 TaxID=2995170 RepID=UPI00226E3685|nr:helix-turn-helix domain-containing protein [Luteolibacter sp. SL250]WAC21683.1 PocR ligand-binding domain-containing protein [Luteolibacter sp. SL250]